MYNWNLRKNSFSLPLPLIFLAQCASFFAEARPLRADAQPKLLELMSVNKIDCSKATQSEKTKCDDCSGAVEKQKKGMNSRANRAFDNDAVIIAGAGSCGEDTEGPTAQKTRFQVGGRNYSCGDQAQRARERIADELAKEAEGCEREIQSACGSYSGPGKDQADKAKKACKDLKDKSNQAGNERKGEAGDMKKNADKSGDNGKGLGSMPQIPQMPQQGGGDDKPQENPPPQQENKTELAESKPPETQVSKIGADTKKSDQVGFGGSTDTRTSTVSPPPGGFGGNGLPLSLASLPNASLHDSHSGSGRDGTGSSSPGGGGGANLAGQGGASPSGTDSKTEPNSSNPYEIGGAAGGKLGAPKGFKSGSDPDSAVADAAKDNFKSDIGDTASKNASEQAAEEAIEDGYTVFRMVKLRYLELKKKGSI